MKTLAETIVEEAALANDASLKLTSYILKTEYYNDITKATDAAVAASVAAKGNLSMEMLANLITYETHGNVEGPAVIAYIRGAYTELFDKAIDKLVLHNEADGIYLVTIFKEVDSYLYGSYDDDADFAENYFFNINGEIDSLIAGSINWENVWNSQLRHNYFESDGYYFRNW